jgi:hypothetical protein
MMHGGVVVVLPFNLQPNPGFLLRGRAKVDEHTIEKVFFVTVGRIKALVVGIKSKSSTYFDFVFNPRGDLLSLSQGLRRLNIVDPFHTAICLRNWWGGGGIEERNGRRSATGT